MPFLTVLIAIALERFIELQSMLKRFNWFDAFVKLEVDKLKKMGRIGSLLGLLLILPLIVLIVDVIGILLFHGLASFLLGVIVLLYCLGPEDLFHSLIKYVKGRQKEDDVNTAKEKANKIVEGDLPASFSELDKAVAKTSFVEFNHKIAAVVFWYALLGPFGAILYRNLTLLCAKAKNDSGIQEHFDKLCMIQGIFDWFPARLAGLLYALAGSFKTGLKPWQKHVFSGYSENHTLLEECGLQSVGFDDEQDDQKSLQNVTEAQALIDRCLIVYTIIIVVLLVLF